MIAHRCAVVATALLTGLGASACRQDMAEQPKYVDNGPAAAFSNNSADRPLIEGTVARVGFGVGVPIGAGDQKRPAVTPALLKRGQERFGIYCMPCHGPAGDGDGRVVERGFPKPPSYHIDRLLSADDQHFFDVITNGLGVMYPYGARVSAADRWAIIAYIRALQLSQNASLAAGFVGSKQTGGVPQ